MLTANKIESAHPANCTCENCCPAREAGRKVRHFIDVATQDARDVSAATQKQIRQNPLAAGAIAAGIGFVLGSLFRRR